MPNGKQGLILILVTIFKVYILGGFQTLREIKLHQ
jgi:hypothetical protein